MANVISLKTGEVLSGDTDLGAIILFDDSGAYSTPGNEGGWETPNLGIADITKTEFTFTDPDGNITLIEDTERLLPNVIEKGFKVTADMLGLPKITSGVWKIKYCLTHAGGTLCSIGYFFMKEEMLCCMDKMATNFNPSKPMSDDDRWSYDLRAMLCIAEINVKLGQESTAREIMEFLNTQTGCNCT